MRVTVAVVVLPPTTEVGLTDREAIESPVMVMLVLAEVVLSLAVMLTVYVDVYAFVVSVKVAVVAPAATVTLAGTVT